MVIKQTTLDLNGPFIAFSVQPTDVTAAGTGSGAGIATFVGIATGYFEDSDPENIFDTNTGEVSYQWYAVGYGVLSDGAFLNTTLTGTGTSTLTVSNLDYTNSGLQFYVNADYTPSAYSQPDGSAVTVGTARSTGEAINDTIDSNVANLIIPPDIVITSQPESLVDSGAVCISLIDETSRSSSEIETSWNSFREIYPSRPFFLLQVNDNDDLHEPDSFKLDQLAIGPIDVNEDKGNPDVVSDWFNICNLLQYPAGTSISLVIDNSGSMKESDISESLALFENQCAAAGFIIYKKSMSGENWVTDHNRELPEQTGLSIAQGSSGTFTVDAQLENGTKDGLSYQWYLEGGTRITEGLVVENVTYTGSTTPTLTASVGENKSIKQPAVCISLIDETSRDRDTIENDWNNFRSNYPSRPFFLLQVDDNDDLLEPIRFKADTLAVGAIPVNKDKGQPNRVSDWFSICNLSQYSAGTSISLVIDNSGSMTESTVSASLDLFEAKCAAAGFVIYKESMTRERWAVDHNRELPENLISTTNKVYVEVSDSNSFNSPVTSDTVSFSIRKPRDVINFEEYDGTSTAKLYYNILNSEGYTYTLSHDKYLCFYAGEKDTTVELDIYGSKGRDVGSPVPGGEGGKSTIRFIAKKNEEYIIAPLQEAPKINDVPKIGFGAVFIYRKAKLMVAVGSGGQSQGDPSVGIYGTNRPGAGGGVNVAGGPSSTRYYQVGAELIEEGTLPSSFGIFGSAYAYITGRQPDLRFGDKYIQPFGTGQEQPIEGFSGGRALSCPRGIYWREQGKQPCEDLGNIQYYNADGTLVTNSAVIDRGFKAGFGIRETAGLCFFPSENIINSSTLNAYGNGGHGATGGRGGKLWPGRAGDGGSGYSDGSVEIVQTQQGGSRGPAKVIFRISKVPTILPTPSLPLKGSVYHTFNNVINEDANLTWTGSVANVISEGKTSPDGLPKGVLNVGYKHYLITMNKAYSSIEISDISFNTAGGGSGPMYLDGIVQVDALNWRVWFNRQNVSNSYVRSFTVRGIL